MPMDYEIDAGRRLVVTRCTGRVSDADIIAYAERIGGDPQFPVEFYSLVDTSEATEFDISVELIRDMIRNRRTPTPLRRAIVAPQRKTLAYGLSRLSAAHLQARGDEVMIFETSEEALKWLYSSPEANAGQAAA